jgi:DNA-binding NarL/FixJ family response regulator
MSKLHLVLADDHVVVREGLKALINGQTDMEVIAEASDGRAALQQVQAHQPDVVIMDVSMPELNGEQATEQLRREYPVVKVLALSIHEDTGYIRRLIEAGAAGYVLKRSAAETLIAAIRAVAAGEMYLDPALASKLVSELMRDQSHASGPIGNDLSEREAEVVRLVAQGYSNKEVAAQLAISVRTIETYKARAMEKLGIDSRAALVRYAAQRGWLYDL